MFEILVSNPVGESFTTNTDSFKYTITGQLMHNQSSIDNT